MEPETFTLFIKLGNDAMRTPEDVAAALEIVTAQVREECCQQRGIYDLNGNRVGDWRFE